MDKFIGKKVVHKRQKKGLSTGEEYRNVVRDCGDAMRKPNAHLELNFAKEIKDNKKGFIKYVNSKKKTRENARLLLNKVVVLIMWDDEKAEMLKAFFASFLVTKTPPWESWALEARERLRGMEGFVLVEEEMVREHLGKIHVRKFMHPSGMYPRVLRESAEMIVEPLSVIFDSSWGTEDLPED